MAATIGLGGPAMADSHAINGPPGLTMAAIIGPQRGGTNDGRGGPTMAATIGPGGPFMAREIAGMP